MLFLTLPQGGRPETWRPGDARLSVSGNALGIAPGQHPHTGEDAPHLLLQLPVYGLRNLTPLLFRIFLKGPYGSSSPGFLKRGPLVPDAPVDLG